MADMETANLEIEVKKDVEMASDSDSADASEDSDSDSESEEVKESKIKELFDKIKSNPYHYDSHVELITLLRKGGELEQLRLAREQMSRLFPLTPELWMEWLTDETIMASQKDDQQEIINLFERSIRDYLSVSVWLEYAQFSIGSMSENPSKIRDVFERALTAVGLHVTDGSMIWEAYREYEIAILASLEASIADDSEDTKEITQQKSRVMNLFKRQLSVPHFDMEKTYEEYQELVEGAADPNIHNIYKKTLKKLESLKPYESSLLATEPPHLSDYLAYLDYEESQGEPARVQCLYERALVDNCLVADLWQRYTIYLDGKLKIETISLPVYERSVRNCPWTVSLWTDYITAAERYKLERDKVKSIADAAFQSGLTTAEDFRMLWMAYLHYLRRSIKWEEDHEKELEQLRIAFQKASDHLNQTFAAEGDPTCSILRYWAKFEAKFCKNITKAREIWNMILHSGPKKSDAETWIEYANLERAFGDDKRYRKTLHRALLAVNDWPESIGELLITFEKEEGTLETLDTAIEKYKSQLARVTEKRKKSGHDHKSPYESSFNSPSHGKRYTNFKRKHGEENAIDSDGFRIPRPRGPKSPMSPQSQIFEEHQKKKVKITNVKDASPKKVNSEVNVPEDETKKQIPKSNKVPHDPAKDKQTVFVSNLEYSVEEEKIKEIFSVIGEIEQVRLVRNYKGKSKGYCYVQFVSVDLAQQALKKDREPINGRPMFVSPCKDQKKQNHDELDPKFRFSTVLEKQKLFIRGLPFSTTQTELEELYQQFGKIKEARLVTYRNGHSKGLAYVEFVDASSATNALLKTDNMEIGSQTISVAYSNPPTRKPKGGYGAGENIKHIAQEKTPSGKGRGKPAMLLVPRVLKRQPILGSNTNGDATPSTSNGTKQKMSNDDFRNLLKK